MSISTTTLSQPNGWKLHPHSRLSRRRNIIKISRKVISGEWRSNKAAFHQLMHRDEELCTLHFLFLAFSSFSETSCHCRRLLFSNVKCEKNACDVRRCIPIIFPQVEFPTHFSSLKSNSHLVVAPPSAFDSFTLPV